MIAFVFSELRLIIIIILTSVFEGHIIQFINRYRDSFVLRDDYDNDKINI